MPIPTPNCIVRAFYKSNQLTTLFTQMGTVSWSDQVASNCVILALDGVLITM